MHLSSWLVVLFAIVLSNFEGLRVVEGSPLAFSSRIVNTRLYKQYSPLFWSFFGKEFNKLLPAPPQPNVTAIRILENNKDLNLGDVLIDKKGEIFFFMAPTSNDPIVSTLMRVSSGLNEPHHLITDMILIKKQESYNVWYMDYRNDSEVNDQFKVFQEYDKFMLLGSVSNSIAFLAPRDNVDGFIRVHLQRRLKEIKDREERKAQEEKKKIYESSNFNEVYSRSNLKNGELSNDNFIESPNSIANPGLHENLSHIEMLFSPDYDSTEMRIKFIVSRFVPMLFEKDLQVSDALFIISRVENIFRHEKMVEYINIADGEELTVVGDIHGQFLDLLKLFKKKGWPSEVNKYLFNGDIIDRGPDSIACLLLLYAFKIALPRSIFINRGNHESETCGPGTFHRDARKFDPSGNFYVAAHISFIALPYAHVINNRVYVVHGGIRSDYYIKEISEMNRFKLDDFSKDFAMASIWDDPSNAPGITENHARGSRMRCFGPDVTEAFLILNDFHYMIRSHSYTRNGIEFGHDGRCLTLFSAPNYGYMGNAAAYIILNSKLHMEVRTFT